MNTDARDNFRTHYRAQVHLNRQNHLQPQMNTDTRDNFRTQTYRAQVHLNRQIFDIGVSDARSLATDLRPIQKLGGNSRSVLHELDLAQGMPSVRARLSAPQPDLLDSHRPQHSYSEPSVALPAHKTTPCRATQGPERLRRPSPENRRPAICAPRTPLRESSRSMPAPGRFR